MSSYDQSPRSLTVRHNEVSKKGSFYCLKIVAIHQTYKERADTKSYEDRLIVIKKTVQTHTNGRDKLQTLIFKF